MKKPVKRDQEGGSVDNNDPGVTPPQDDRILTAGPSTGPVKEQTNMKTDGTMDVEKTDEVFLINLLINEEHPGVEDGETMMRDSRGRGGIPPGVQSSPTGGVNIRANTTASTPQSKPKGGEGSSRPASRTGEGSRTSEEEDNIEGFRTQSNQDAQQLINYEFARKVVEMDALLKSKLFRTLEHSTEVHRRHHAAEDNYDDDVTSISRGGGGVKRRRTGDSSDESPRKKGVLAAVQPKIYGRNVHIDSLVDTVRPHLDKMLVNAKTIRLWINLGTPKIEDGNNFGVCVQEAVMAEATSMEQMVKKRLESLNAFYSSRVDHVQRTIDCPGVEDAVRALREFDQMMYTSLQGMVIDMRDKYAGLLDKLQKNRVKMSRPRIDNSATMY